MISTKKGKVATQKSGKKPALSSRTGLTSPRLTKKYVQYMKEKSPEFR